MMDKTWALVTILFLIIMSIVVFQYGREKETVIEIGLYSGNEWGVPQIDVYKIYDEAIELFEAQHDGVKVVYRSGTLMGDYSEWLAQKSLKGDEPDVFIVLEEDFNTLAEIGMLEPLDGYLQTSEAFNLEDYYQKALEAGQYNGQQMSMPFEVVPTFLAMNKSLLKSEGQNVPDVDWTMEDYLTISERLTKDKDGDNDFDTFGTIGYEWDMAYYAMNGTFDEGDKAVRVYKEDILKNAIDYMKALQNLNKGHVVSNYDFSQGKVGFKSFSLAEFRAFKPYPYKVKKYSNFDWGAIPYPRQDNYTGKSKLYTVQWGMSSRSKEKELAWDFIRFMTEDPRVQEMVWDYTYALPTKISVVDKIYGEMDSSDSVLDPAFLKLVMDQSVVEPTFKSYNRIREVMDIRIKVNIFEGHSTQEIIRSIRRDVDETIFNSSED